MGVWLWALWKVTSRLPKRGRLRLQGAVAEELQVAGFESGVAVGPVVQHLHQHLEGGGIYPPRAETIVDETGLQHGHIQPLGLMDAGEAIRRFPQGGRRDDHKVNRGSAWTSVFCTGPIGTGT